MTIQYKNTARILEILRSGLSEGDVAVAQDHLRIGEYKLDFHDDNDVEVIKVLLANTPFSDSVQGIENGLDDLHDFQDLPMTDRRARKEVEAARNILQRHYDAGFLLGVWHEQYDGICFRYAEGRYSELAERDSEDKAA